jgi:O-antigen/teichoic acid export membrane protein
MVLWRGVAIVIGSATAILLARWLGPHDRGELALILLWISLSAVVLQAGFPEASIYVIGAKLFPEGQVLSTLSLYFAGLVALVGGVAFLVLTRILGFDSLPAALIAVSLATSVLLAVLRHILIAHRSFARYSLSVVLEGAVNLAVVVLFHTSAALTIENALCAYAASLLSTALLLGAWQYRDARGLLHPRHFTPAVLAKCWRFGYHLFATGLGSFGVQRVNYFLLESLAGSRAVGLFAAASSLPALFANLPQQLATVLYSHVAKSDAAEGVRLTLVVVKLLALACVALLIPVLIWREQLALLIFGSAFAGIGTTMVLLSVAMSLTGLTGVLLNSLAGMGLPKYGSYMTYLGVALAVTLGTALTWAGGLEGAATAQLVTAAAMLGFVAAAFCRRGGVRGRALLSLSVSEIQLLSGSPGRRGVS